MKYLFIFLLAAPLTSMAHGLVEDGHGTSALAWIELGGIVIVSLGLLLYSFSAWKKDKNK
jgi:hypothetical protein